MKGLIYRLFYCCAMLVLLSASVQAATYAFRSTAYNWESANTDVVWDQTQTDHPRDDDKQTVNLGFTFNFAGVNYTQVLIHANGVLQFGNNTQFHRQYTNTTLPVTTPPQGCTGCTAGVQADRLLAVYWDDIDPRLGGTVRYETKGTAQNRRFVVSWDKVPHYNYGGQYSFQIILYENGEFVYQYGSGNASGVSATIGVEVDNTDYTLYSFDSSFSYAGTAIRWFKPSGEPQRLAEYWFEEFIWNNTPNEVVDWSGNGYNGNAIGNALSVANGKVCRAADITLNTDSTVNGINTNIDVDSAIGASGSISFWYRNNTSWDRLDNQLFDATAVSEHWFYLTKTATGSLRFVISDSAGTTVEAESGSINVAAQSWKHIAVTWRLATGTNQTVLRIYLDGNLLHSHQGTTNGSLPVSLSTLILGDNAQNIVHATGGTLNSADGRIDEVRVYNFEISNADVQNDMHASHDCVLINHLRIEHDGHGLTCATKPVTLKACSNSSCSSLYSGVVTASITLNGSSAGGITFSGGSTSFMLGNSTAGNVTLGGSISPPAASSTRCFNGATESCNMVFTDTGWLFDTIAPQVSGVAFNSIGLQAVRKNNNTGACQAELNGVQSVQLRLSCVDPASCSADSTMQFKFTDGGNIVRALSKNSFAAYILAFNNNGRAELRTPSYLDVGRIRIDAQKQMDTGAVLSGSSNAFVVRPHTLAVVGVERLNGTANPASTNSGTGFVAAGEAFRVMLESQNANSQRTANFGRETSPERLTVALKELSYPTDGNSNPAQLKVNGDFSAVTGMAGRVVNNQVSWQEAGSIRIHARLTDNNYLGAGDVQQKTASGTIGRFYPDYFHLASSHVSNSCQVFSYMSEPALTVNYQLEAKGRADNTLHNYHTAYFPTGTANMLVVAQDTGTRLAASRLAVQAGQWQHGIYVVEQSNARFNRVVAPDGPYSKMQLGLKIVSEQDSRNFQSFTLGDDALALNGELDLRFGRLVLRNGAGPEDEALPLAFNTEYWRDGRFITNSEDNCSLISNSSVLLSTISGTSVLSLTGSGGVVANGRFPAQSLTLAPPGVPGIWQVEYMAEPWLQFFWRGAAPTYQQNPQAEFMFGRFRGNPRQIFWRELLL